MSACLFFRQKKTIPLSSPVYGNHHYAMSSKMRYSQMVQSIHTTKTTSVPRKTTISIKIPSCPTLGTCTKTKNIGKCAARIHVSQIAKNSRKFWTKPSEQDIIHQRELLEQQIERILDIEEERTQRWKERHKDQEICHLEKSKVSLVQHTNSGINILDNQSLHLGCGYYYHNTPTLLIHQNVTDTTSLEPCDVIHLLSRWESICIPTTPELGKLHCHCLSEREPKYKPSQILYENTRSYVRKEEHPTSWEKISKHSCVPPHSRIGIGILKENNSTIYPLQPIILYPPNELHKQKQTQCLYYKPTIISCENAGTSSLLDIQWMTKYSLPTGFTIADWYTTLSKLLDPPKTTISPPQIITYQNNEWIPSSTLLFNMDKQCTPHRTMVVLENATSFHLHRNLQSMHPSQTCLEWITKPYEKTCKQVDDLIVTLSVHEQEEHEQEYRSCHKYRSTSSPISYVQHCNHALPLFTHQPIYLGCGTYISTKPSYLWYQNVTDSSLLDKETMMDMLSHWNPWNINKTNSLYISPTINSCISDSDALQLHHHTKFSCPPWYSHTKCHEEESSITKHIILYENTRNEQEGKISKISSKPCFSHTKNQQHHRILPENNSTIYPKQTLCLIRPPLQEEKKHSIPISRSISTPTMILCENGAPSFLHMHWKQEICSLPHGFTIQDWSATISTLLHSETSISNSFYVQPQIITYQNNEWIPNHTLLFTPKQHECLSSQRTMVVLENTTSFHLQRQVQHKNFCIPPNFIRFTPCHPSPISSPQILSYQNNDAITQRSFPIQDLFPFYRSMIIPSNATSVMLSQELYPHPHPHPHPHPPVSFQHTICSQEQDQEDHITIFISDHKDRDCE
jgi:hypothetical protein